MCQLDYYYTRGTAEESVQDPGNLRLYTLAGSGMQICYSCADGSGVDVNSAYDNCRICGDNTFEEWNFRNSGIFEPEATRETEALQSSVGCAVCQDEYFPEIHMHPVLTDVVQRTCVEREDPTAQAGQMCTWSRVFKYDPD